MVDTYDTSILDDIKKVLGIDSDYEVFDLDIILHINSAFSTLHQLGVGPKIPFMIADKESKWNQFTTDRALASVKQYMYISVRLVFDTPETSFGIENLKAVKQELEFRLNVASETPG